MSRFKCFLGDFGQKSVFFLGQKQCFLGKKCTITWYVLHILLSEFANLQLGAKNDPFVAKKVNMLLTKFVIPIFALAERLPTSAALL